MLSVYDRYYIPFYGLQHREENKPRYMWITRKYLNQESSNADHMYGYLLYFSNNPEKNAHESITNKYCC